MADTIGAYTFDLLKGEVKRYQPTLETFTRSGVNGAEDRLVGYRGEPFTIESISRAASLEAGEEQLHAYAALVLAGQQKFIKDGLDWDDVGTGYRVKVLAPLDGSVRFTPAIVTPNGAFTNTYVIRGIWRLRMEPKAA